uniref:Uncharacterized protein n=1 Tax=Caenorhabditis japonica TaxID=281687 RepID=A0A8R1E0D0_CAEJA
MVSDKKYLVGFPQGSQDFHTLLKDLDSANLEQFLNHGRSLAELKNLLKPVLDVELQVSKAKKVWPESIWPVVVTFFSMLLSCACGPVCYWCRTTIDEVREKTRY